MVIVSQLPKDQISTAFKSALLVTVSHVILATSSTPRIPPLPANWSASCVSYSTTKLSNAHNARTVTSSKMVVASTPPWVMTVTVRGTLGVTAKDVPPDITLVAIFAHKWTQTVYLSTLYLELACNAEVATPKERHVYEL